MTCPTFRILGHGMSEIVGLLSWFVRTANISFSVHQFNFVTKKEIMRSTFKLLYFVKRNAVKKNGNAPIIARITIDQVVAQFNTKLEINPAHWSVKLGKASGRTAEAVHINSMLENIHSTVPQQD